MFWLKIISKFVNAFRAGETPAQIAAGFTLGFLIGLMPFWTLQGVVLLVVLLLFNVNLAAGTVAMVLAGMVAYLLDPIFHSVGYFMLTGVSFLQPVWEALYNMPVAPLSRFNNTVVMGSFVCGVVLALPLYWGMKKLVQVYRAELEARLVRWKVVQAIKGSKVVQLYFKVRDFRGA